MKQSSSFSYWGKSESEIPQYLLLTEIPGVWYHLLHILSGTGILTNNRGNQKVGAGHLLILQASDKFILESTGSPIKYTYFLVEGECTSLPHSVILEKPPQNLNETLTLLEKHTPSTAPGSGSDLLNEFFARLSESVSPQHPVCASYWNGINKLKGILDTRYMETLHLDDFAQELYINKFKLVKEFKKQYGIPPIEYLLNRRINEACRLLRDTGMKVVDIGCRVGIRNPTYLSRVFKSQVGCTPLAYRHRFIG